MKRETLTSVYQSLDNVRQFLLDAMVEIDDCIEDNNDAPFFELNHINNKIHDTIVEIVNLEKGYAKMYHVSSTTLLRREKNE